MFRKFIGIVQHKLLQSPSRAKHENVHKRPNPEEEALWNAHFLQRYFGKLPGLVLQQVFSYPGLLEVSELLEVLVHVSPHVRDVIFNSYYRKEVRFVLNDKISQNKRFFLERTKPFRDFFSIFEIETFFKTFPEVNPSRIELFGGKDFVLIRSILTKYKERFKAIPDLAITLYGMEIVLEDLYLVFSFPNLLEIDLRFCEYSAACRGVLDRELLNHKRLKKANISSVDPGSWKVLRYDECMTLTEMEYHKMTGIATVTLPSTLTNVSFQDSTLDPSNFDRISNLPFLTILMASGTNLTSLNVSKLPQTLETIDVSRNPIVDFETEGKNPYWPPLLKFISIGSSTWTNAQLEQLSAIAWPPLLETLEIKDTPMPSLENLRGLPGSLKHLDLSRTGIQTLSVLDTIDNYPFFRFPPCLVSLKMSQGSFGAVDYDILYDSNGILLDPRIEFPSSLENLHLTGCGIRNLNLFRFPSTLKTLSLSLNEIEDIVAYEDGQITKSVTWQDLKNLEKLDLTNNRLKCLHNWLPPPSLRELKLRQNDFEELDPSLSILFQKRYYEYSDKLSLLDLGSNRIKSIHRSLVLPRNLLRLWLDTNGMSSFEFTDEIASHKNLIELNLASNRIEKVTLQKRAKRYSMNLNNLNLSFNTVQFTKSKKKLYKVSRRLGLTNFNFFSVSQ